MALIENPQEDSDEAPEEFSFETGKKELQKSIQIQNEEILKSKQKVKKTRRLIHERNIAQKEEKRKRLEDFERKKLPDDVLNSLKEFKEKQLKTEVEITPKRPKDRSKTKNKLSATQTRMKKKKKLKDTKERDSDVKGLDVILQVRPLNEEVKKAETLAAKAARFRTKQLYGNRAAPRISSHKLRMMGVKRREGIRVQTSSY